MASFAAFLPVVSSVLQAGSSVIQGNAADKVAGYEATQLEQRAGQTRATAQRQAIEDRRRARLANSRLQALAGGGGGDVTAVKLASDIAGEGEYKALSSLYEGEESAVGDEQAAMARRMEGKNAKRAGRIKLISSIFSSAGDIMGAFGGGKPFGGGSTYNYANDASGAKFSATGADVRARR